MAINKSKQEVSAKDIENAEKAIDSYSRSVKFTVTEYTFEFIVQRLQSERYYVPDYQRKLIWNLDKQSKFIESIFMGLPIPFVFFWQDDSGKMEIVDGSQRLRTIKSFIENKLILRGLRTIREVNGLRHDDFPKSRQLKFAETPIRVIVLDNATDAVTRTEMFARINTGGTLAEEAEVRRGSLPGPFMDLVIRLSNTTQFVELTPISEQLINKREREELITRFFAYLENYDQSMNEGKGDIPNYRDDPRRFYFQFIQDMNAKIGTEIEDKGKSLNLERMENEFLEMLAFVKQVSPYGFTKSPTGKQVPRVRFEAIAVGSALALRANKQLPKSLSDITPFLVSSAFVTATRSDAANVKRKLLTRIGLLKEWLQEQ